MLLCAKTPSPNKIAFLEFSRGFGHEVVVPFLELPAILLAHSKLSTGLILALLWTFYHYRFRKG